MKNENEFDVVDHLAMLLTAFAQAAVSRHQTNAAQLIKDDEYAQAHFAGLSAALQQVAGVDPALIEYSTDAGAPPKLVIHDGDENRAAHFIWRRIV